VTAVLGFSLYFWLIVQNSIYCLVLAICTTSVLSSSGLAQSLPQTTNTSASVSEQATNTQKLDGRAYNQLLSSFIPNYGAGGDVKDGYLAPVFTTPNIKKHKDRWNPELALQIEKFQTQDTISLKIDEMRLDQRLWQVGGNRDQPIALVTPHTCIIKMPNQQYLYLASRRWEQSRTFRADDPSPVYVEFGKGFSTKRFIACGGVLADLKNVSAPYKETVYFYAMEIEAKHKMYFSACPKGSLDGCALYKAKATLSVIAKPKSDSDYILPNKFGPNKERREYTPMAVLDLGEVIIEDQRAGQGLFTRLFSLNSPNFILSFIAGLVGCC
jgi:hypothetical protein